MDTALNVLRTTDASIYKLDAVLITTIDSTLGIFSTIDPAICLTSATLNGPRSKQLCLQ